MAKYDVTAPNGQTYEIEGPDGASEDQVIGALLYNNPEANVTTPKAPAPEAPRGAWDRFTDSYKAANQEGFPGFLARKYHDYTNTGKEQLRKAYPGRPEEWYETVADNMVSQTQRQMREDAAARQEADPAWRPDESWASNLLHANRWGPYLAGQLIGSPGVEDLVAPGTGSLLKEMGIAGGVNAVADLAYQGLDNLDNVREGLDFTQAAISGGLGAGLQGVVGGIARGADALISGKADVDPMTPGVLPDSPAGLGSWTPERVAAAKEDIANRIDSGQSFEEIAQAQPELAAMNGPEIEWYVEARKRGNSTPVAFREVSNEAVGQPAEPTGIGPQAPVTPEEGGLAGQLQQEAEAFQQGRRPEPTPEDVFPTEESRALREQEMTQKLEAEAEAWKTKKAEAPVETGTVPPVDDARTARVQSVADEINNVTNSWTNAPEFSVVHSLDDLDPDVAARVRQETGEGAKAFIDDSGKIHVIAQNLTDKSDIPAMVYHEALGHAGMSNVFRSGLDDMLVKFYDGSPDFRATVDDWIEANPGQYADRPDFIARASDEVLAEMSEGGPLAASFIDKVKNFIKYTARRAGLKNVEYSDREIRTILAMAHDSVINGKGGNVSGNGFRYMYVGKNARLNDMAKMFDFNEAAALGEDPVSLRDKYGFFRGPDRQLRREIPDDTARYDMNDIPQEGVYLEQVLDHPELFENYPQLRDIVFTRHADQGDWRQTSQGWYSPGDNQINVTPYAKDPEGTLIHEIQHWIQNYEDWASGGTPESSIRAMSNKQFEKFREDFIKESTDQYNEERSLYNMYQQVIEDFYTTDLADDYKAKYADYMSMKPDFNNPEFVALYDAAQDARLALFEKLTGEKSFIDAPGDKSSNFYTLEKDLLGATEDDFYDIASSQLKQLEEIRNDIEALWGADRKTVYRASRGSKASFKAYQNLFGELEARDAAARRLKTQQQRDETLPYSIGDDLDENDLILDRGNRAFARSTEESESQPRYMREGSRAKSMTPEKVRTVNDLDDLLSFIGKETEHLAPDSQSVTEINRLADDLGLSASKYLRGKSFEDQKLAVQIRGAHQLLTNQVERLSELGKKAKEQGMTPSLWADIQEKLATVKAVYAKFDADKAELGRSLRMLREASYSKKSQASLDRFMAETEGVDLIKDPEAVARLLENLDVANQIGDTGAAARAVKNFGKLHAEDYIGSVIFNFMLSSPVTWFKNVVGSPMNFATDFAVDSIAATVGQLGRRTGSDRIHGRELIARGIYGPMAAFQNYKTYKNLWDTAQSGQSRMIGLEGKVGGTGVAFTGPAGVIETPRRIQATVDEFWSNIFFMSNLYGEAAHVAARKGLKGNDFKTELQNLVNSPTKEMQDAAKNATVRQLFRDKPSRLGQAFVDVTTPRYEDKMVIEMVKDSTTDKYVPIAKTVQPKDSAAMRAGKFGTRLVVPFVPTLDSIARTIVRNSGPLALFSGEIRRDILAGGVAQQSALARVALSTAVLTGLYGMAQDGLITGAPVGDWRKNTAQGDVIPPYSIKVGDQWISYQGFDPIAGQLAAAATAAQQNRGKDSAKEIFTGMVIGMASALKNSSYAESLSNLINMSQEGLELVERGETRGAAINNFLAGQASNALTPSFVRWLNQEFVDPAARDTSADGDIGSRALARAKAGIPGLSSDLPQKYDVFGRPKTNPRQDKFVETDPTILEINRLEGTQSGVVMGPPDKTIYKNTDNQMKLNAEQFQQYQLYSGQWALQDIKEAMSDPSWNDLTDQEKIKEIKSIISEARADARAELFPKEEEDVE